MSSPTDKPLARAQAHLASARYAEAAGAFRAVLHIDPREFQAHFGLADALVARGQRAEAIEGLIQAAEACGQQDDHAAALTLYGKALSIDPGRLELHLDVAIAEAALGRDEAAQARLENLAEIYMQAGRTDEAAEVFRFIASWEEEEVEEELEELATPATTTARHTAVPMQIPTSETVVIPTILITPDGQLLQMPIDRQASEPVPLSKDPTIPPIPAELIEAARSKPIDLDDDAAIEQVEGTVVAFPPPPPALPEEARARPPRASREDLEAALAAAMENLALVERMEEEDETLVMKAPLLAPRKKKVITRGPSAADGKLRLDRAPRPKAAPSKAPAPSKPDVPSKTPAPSKSAAPARAPADRRPLAGRPVTPAPRPGPAKAPRPAPAPAKTGPAPAPRPAPRAAAPSRPAPSKAAPPPAAPTAGGPKPTRPDNPLVERLRRRAGFNNKEGRPRSARTRATEPIAVGRSATPRRPGSDPEPE